MTELASTRPKREPIKPTDRIPGGTRLLVLATKVVPPRCQGLILRPRLLAVAAQLFDKRLAVIKAPAGFGKTSLVATWLPELQKTGSAVAWLTIDPNDDEPATFMLYVCHALQRASGKVGPGAIELIEESLLIEPHLVWSALINDLAELDEDVFLVLEDYHWILHPEIHTALGFFLRRAPSNCHVVLTSRTEPPLPLASLRAQNLLLEVDAAALRFDVEETRQFVEADGPGALGPADVRLLREKTSGWPAALRIVTSTSAQSNQDLAQYVRSLSGVQSSIGAFLGELLDGLPRDMVQFMLRTSILSRLSVALCEAVTGANAGVEWLGSIAQSHLLVSPLDHEGRWFRYHPLLAEYLSQRLKAELGNEIPGLHQRASVWYAAEEMWTDAVQHAFAAGDTVRAVGWIKHCAMQLVKQGELFTLLGWQRLLPAGVMRGQPEVGLAVAWGLALAVRHDEALERLNELGRDLDAAPAPRDDALRCESDTIRSVALALKDDSEPALAIAADCLGRSTDPWIANVASNVVRFGHLRRGDLRQFYATPWIPYSLDDDRRNVFASVYYRCLLGMAEAQQLRVTAAERYYQHAQRLAEQHVGPDSVAASLPLSLLAHIRYEQGRLDEAEAMLIDRMPVINAGTMLDCVLSANLVMARIAMQRTHWELARTLLERAENLGHTRGWGRLSAAAVLEQMRLSLCEGRTEEAMERLDRLERLAAAYPAATSCAWSDIHRYAALARAYAASAQHRPEEAAAILRPLQLDLENAHHRHFALRVEMLAAAMRFRTKPSAEELARFDHVVAAFAEAGIHRSILDEAMEIGPLLLAYRESELAARRSLTFPTFMSGLLAAWNAPAGPENPPSQNRANAGALSRRESDILRLIGEGFSNKEIARELAIAPETVKSHLKHVFTKLNVEKRAQAVSRAQILGLAGTGRQ